ncbi:hypothetical protein Pd630_LPD16106 (plasmid) [Rhodococcus opacus PD630]|nr:hypothetical protein Pd630_LPD16106 [Rhodococcus opacus PD630]
MFACPFMTPVGGIRILDTCEKVPNRVLRNGAAAAKMGAPLFKRIGPEGAHTVDSGRY